MVSRRHRRGKLPKSVLEAFRRARDTRARNNASVVIFEELTKVALAQIEDYRRMKNLLYRRKQKALIKRRRSMNMKVRQQL